jgi:hypothetical protein
MFRVAPPVAIRPAASVAQGFASGDCDHDAQSIRAFLADGHKVGVSQSYAKNMGLYGQRVGCLSIVCDNARDASAVESQLKAIARPLYSNPPLHGALLVTKILQDAQLRGLWFQVRGGGAEGGARSIGRPGRRLAGEGAALGGEPWPCCGRLPPAELPGRCTRAGRVTSCPAWLLRSAVSLALTGRCGGLGCRRSRAWRTASSPCARCCAST